MKKKIAVLLLLFAVLFGVWGCGSQEQFDVIVVGGDPEGISAAVTAARNGMKTLLVEDDEALGGLMTLGGLNFIDMCNGRDGTLLTRGTFKEFYDAVGGTAFDIETAKEVFMKMVTEEENLTLQLNTRFVEPVMQDNTITGVVLEQDGRQHTYKSKNIIDATVDADVAAAAGADYTYLGEDFGQRDGKTGVTLVFSLSGVNWHEVAQYLNGDDNPNTGATEKAAWGYNEESFTYEPKDEQTRLRGLNIALQNDGSVLVNGFIIFGVDPLSAESKTAGMERGKAELEHIVPYLQQNFVGFENAQLIGTAEQLYIRESRHILGEYQLTLDDVLENRNFDDKIALGSYPVDVPPNGKRTVGIILGNPDRYGVPFRCLVPLKVDGMLVVGRSASYTSLAAGSARVIPLGMAEGDAAGVAAAYAVKNKISFRQISQDTDAIASVQQTLKDQGAYLEDWTKVEEAAEQHWAYPGVKVMRNLALVYGGYQNDYRLDEPITAQEATELLMGLWQYHNKDGIVSFSNTPTCEEILKAAADTVNLKANSATEALINADILTEQLQPYFADAKKATNRAEVIMLLANLHDFMRFADNYIVVPRNDKNNS